MPRKNRQFHNSKFLHVMMQGINKEEIFKEDFYKNLYLKLIMTKSKEFNINILAYALMNNHAHLLINYFNIEDVSIFMHKANQEFAQLYNKNKDRVGHVFRNRYKSEEITSKDYLYTVLAYIHFNPYKAEIISKLSDYKYSSYKKFIDGNISKEKVYILFNTYDYKNIFREIHRRYFDKVLNTQKMINQILDDFIKENKLKDLKNLRKNKKLLIELILKLKIETNLKENEICKLLGIGKNRITELKKQGLGEVSP